MKRESGLSGILAQSLSPSAKRLIDEAGDQRQTRIYFPRTRAVRILTFAVAAVPIAWLLGVAEFVWPLLVLPMFLFLAKRPRVLLPRAVFIWLAFLALVIVAAAGAGSGVHMLTVHLSATVIFLFAYNTTTDELPDSVIVTLVAAYWCVLAVGGLLGLLLGTVELPSLGHALFAGGAPEGSWLDEVTLVQFSDPLKAGELSGLLFDHRPKGFLPYANHWGSALVMFIPSVLLLRLRLRKGRLARWLDLAMLTALVPFIISRNRWAWLSLVIVFAYVAARFWVANPRIAKAALGTLIAISALVGLSPLGDVVVNRFENENSNQFRSEQYRLSFDLIEESPWLGFGVNQVSEEVAIVGGDEVVGLRLGSDSQILQTMINHGLPALGLFGLWLVVIVVKTRSLLTPTVAMAHLGAIVAMIHTPFYILMPHRWMFLMLLAGAAFRQLRLTGQDRPIAAWTGRAGLEAQARRRRRG